MRHDFHQSLSSTSEFRLSELKMKKNRFSKQLFQEEARKTQSRICCISPLFGHKPSYTEPAYPIGLLIGIIKSRYEI